MWKEIQKRLNSPDSYVSLVLGLAIVLVVGMLVTNYINTRRQPEKRGQTDQEAAKQENMALPTTHTVAEGETLWSIAEKYYKSGYNWVDLKQANNLADENDIEAGQTLTIPTATPIVPAEPTAMPAANTPKTYTVVADDNLWNIAIAQYGNGYKWTEIARVNKLTNPDLIYPGNVLTLP